MQQKNTYTVSLSPSVRDITSANKQQSISDEIINELNNEHTNYEIKGNKNIG
jgi:hypothetical protein